MTALAAAFAAGPASADNLETFTGSATARGLNISVVNPVDSSKIQATLGAASAAADSTLKATATGQGEIVPPNLQTVKTATATADTPTIDAGQGCAETQPAALDNVVSLGVACGSASASIAGNLPVAKSEGSIAGLSVEGQTALAQLDALPVNIGDTLSSTLDTVCQTLDATCTATTTVNDLVNTILKTPTLDVSVGKSNSSVVTTANSIVSTATATGAVVKIFPLPQVNGLPSTDPLVTISVGAASATASYDRSTGVSTSSFDPALVRVVLNPLLAQTLNIDSEYSVSGPDLTLVNSALANLDDTPLASRIVVGNGSKTSDAHSASAVADGVSLRLLMGLGESSPGAHDGGITLELAHAEAGIAGTPAVITPPAPRIETPRELPRTGGNPFIPVAGVAALGVAVLTRRTWLRAATDK